MKLIVLVDNHTYIDQYFHGEPASSFYIEIDDSRILFDAGYSDIVLSNAEKMGIELNNLTHVVLSHGHDDHTRGLIYLEHAVDFSKIKLIAHPDCFNRKICDGEDIGAPYRLEAIEKKFQYYPCAKTYHISANCIFLGEIPNHHAFEARRPIGMQEINGEWQDDYVMEDSALVCNTKKGLFIITGCSHSGICNIIEYAASLYPNQRIYGVLGGFHLFKNNERLQKTIQYLKQIKAEKIYPCHCTSLEVKSEMMQVLDVTEVGVGLRLDFHVV